MPTKAKGDKKIEMEKEEDDEGGEAGIEATLQMLVASIGKLQEDIQEIKNDQKETKATIVAEKDRVLKMQMETKSSMSAEMNRALDIRDQQMGQRFGRLGGASEVGVGETEPFGEIQQNLSQALQTPGPGFGSGLVGNGAHEEKMNQSGESAAKALVRGGSVEAEEPVGDDGGGSGDDLYENHIKSMNNVSLGTVERSDIFYKTFQAELNTATGTLTDMVDVVARVMRSQLGLNRDGTQYFANCTTRAQVLLIADMLAQEKHNAEGLTGQDPSVLSKCLSILCKTNKRSTDDEVAKQIAIHNLQINKKSARAYAFGQKFNSCAGAALLAMMHRLGQTMNHAAVLAVCCDSDTTKLGMDRALFDSMRRIYDSESITVEKIKRAIREVSDLSAHPRVDAGIAGCYHELASRLASVRRMMEIYGAFHDEDLALRQECAISTDLVDRMPTRYQAGVATRVPPYLIPTYQEHTYRLANDLRETIKRLTKDSRMVGVPLMERIVQAAAGKGARVDTEIQQTLFQDFGAGGSQMGAFTSGGGLPGGPRADWAGAVVGRGGDARMQGQGQGRGQYGIQGQGRGIPGRGVGRGGGRGPPPSIYSEVKVRVGPVPVDWSFHRVKDALFHVTQVDVAFVGRTAPDGTVVASYRDDASAKAAVRALAGRTLVSGGPTISASVVTPTATANRAQVEWMGVTDAADGGAMVAYDGSLEEVLDAVDSSVPYELLRPGGEIENSRSQPGVPGDEGTAGAAVSRRAMMEPADETWGGRLEDGSLMVPESRMNDICDQWQSLDRGAGLNGYVQFSQNGNVRIVQNMAPNTSANE